MMLGRSLFLAASASVLAVLLPGALPAGQWVDWQWMNPLPQGQDLLEVAAQPGLSAVAVGDAGTVLVHDGDGWRLVAGGQDHTWFDVVSDGHVLVAIGGRQINTGEWLLPDYGVISSSEDGLVWTERFRTEPFFAADVLHDGTKFVAVGSHLVATSPDGLSWQEHPLPPDLEMARLGNIAWNGHRFVARGVTSPYFGQRAIFISDDGMQWSKVPLGEEIPQMSLAGPAWGNGRFVLVGGVWPGVVFVLTSEDGVAWTVSPTRQPPPPLTTCLVYENGGFVAAGEYPGQPEGWVSQSPDGESWTTHAVDIDEAFHDITWLGDHYQAVGQDGVMATSPDAVTWTETSSNAVDFDRFLTDMTWAPDIQTLVAVGTENMVATSEDSVTWRSQALPARYPEANLHKVRRIDGSFWVGSEYGTLWRSADGLTWTVAHDELCLCELVDIAGHDGTLVVVGVDREFFTPLIVVSHDSGASWERQDFWNVENRLAHVVWFGDRYLALGNQGLVMTSTDGETWVTSQMEGVLGFEAIAESGEKVLIVGSTLNQTGDLIITTEDSVDFAVAESPLRYLRDITWTGTHFVAVGYDGMITSRDGVTWERDEHGLNVVPFCVAGDGTTLYVAGSRGKILRAHHVSTVPRVPGGRVGQRP